MLYTIDEVAKMLQVHPRTVRRYIEKGQLRGERIGGGWRVSEAAVKALFDASEVKDAIDTRLTARADDMLDTFLQGKHRLQQKGFVALLAFVFNPKTEASMLANIDKWIATLNQQGQDAQFDFVMRGGENGLFRILLIAPPAVAQAMIGELEALRG